MLPSPVAPGEVSLAIQGPQYYATVSLTREKILSIMKRLSNSTLSKTAHVADIAQLLERQKWVPYMDSNVAATILVHLAQVAANDISRLPDSYIYPDQGQASGHALHDPLVEYPALFPGRSPDAEMDTINNRINVHRQNHELEATKRPIYFKYAAELAELLIPPHVQHTGTPLSAEEVVISQTKPRQKQKHIQLLPFMSGTTPCSVKAFQKVEPYPNPKSPRNISTVQYSHLLNMSRFTLSMKRQLKQHPAFGPGHTPQEFQTLIAGLTTQRLMARDFSSFDGTVSRFLNEVVELICQRWCHPTHWQEFQSLLRSEWTAMGGSRLWEGDPFVVVYNMTHTY